jgi:hypothetical protein
VAQDTLSGPGEADGIYRIVDLYSDSPSAQGTYTALDITNWTDTIVEFNFTQFFEDGDDPRNYIQDPNELTIGCPGVDCSEFEVRIKYISYRDDDLSGDFTSGDTIFGVQTSASKAFTLNNYPDINALHPDSVYRRHYVSIIGDSFGCSQGEGEVRIAGRPKAQDPQLGLGRLLGTVRLWSNTLIEVRMTVPKKWQGKTAYMWVEKCGMKSNYKAVQILLP